MNIGSMLTPFRGKCKVAFYAGESKFQQNRKFTGVKPGDRGGHDRSTVTAPSAGVPGSKEKDFEN